MIFGTCVQMLRFRHDILVLCHTLHPFECISRKEPTNSADDGAATKRTDTRCPVAAPSNGKLQVVLLPFCHRLKAHFVSRLQHLSQRLNAFT